LQATVSFKLIKKIKDDKFDEEKLQRYTLLIQLGVRDLQVAVVDSTEHRLLFFEDYIFNDLNNHTDFQTVVQSLFESHELLMAGFWKTVVMSVKNNLLTQVPEPLFVEDQAPEYLHLNASFDPAKNEVLFCHQSRTNAVTVFAIPKELKDWISTLYRNSSLQIVHQSAALIDGVLYESQKIAGNPLYIYVDRFKLHILSATDGRFVYYNQFIIKQFSDYIKYIMLVMNGLGMDQSNSQVILWGYIGKNSPHYQEFYKYIRNVVFGTRPDHLKYGYMFDEVQDHHFFDLFSMNLM
jgi:Protein of unknown function (DUF3822)